MKLKQLYNPNEIHTGFFDAYFIRPFIVHYADFKGQEDKESLLFSLLAWFIVTLGIVGLMLGQIGIIGPDGGIGFAVAICTIWGVASIVPIAALFIRNSHGAPEHKVRGRMLTIDILQCAACGLFFILGLLMMITTFNSGSLNPNARVYEEDNVRFEEKEYVKEEPIFTYETVDIPEDDILSDSTSSFSNIDEENRDADDSYDPTIEPELILDSIF